MQFSLFHSRQSGWCNPGSNFRLATLLGLWLMAGLHAQVVVVPNELATTDGNDISTVPGGPIGGLRVMQIYDASEFGALSGPSFITQFAFRPDKITSSSGPKSTTLKIYASTTSRSAASLSGTFADNLGTNNRLVFDGTLMQSTKNLPGPGNTRQFDVVYPFTTPFLFDPAAGNLLLDIQVSEQNGPAITFDGVTGATTFDEIIGFGSTTLPTGERRPGLPKVIQFTFEPSPQVTIRTSQVEVCWKSKTNFTYQVQYRSDLTANVWTPLVNCVRSTSLNSCIADSVVAGQPQKFYRVVLANCPL